MFRRHPLLRQLTTMGSPSKSYRYDVFLSFRGLDTRKTFVSHLYRELRSKSITTFKDDRDLHPGDFLPNKLPEAIQGSKFAVVVISENYASSGWCLNELAIIMELKQKGTLDVFPIFYMVDPSDVRKQEGTFGEAFRKHDIENPEMVDKWRQALTEVANLTGVVSQDWNEEADMVCHVGRDILERLFAMSPKEASDLIGMDALMGELQPLLSIGLDDEVRMIGIWGMGGVGKTTIAKHLYKNFSRQFKFHCFIENIKKLYSERGVENLQREFLSKILKDENPLSPRVEVNSNAIQERFSGRKILAILDDVDDSGQLEALARRNNWFGRGSRIIITTRDVGLLRSHGITLVHEAKCLARNLACNLFNQFAFNGGQVPNEFKSLAVRAANLVGGLPLALKVLGLYLRGREKEDWEVAVERLRNDPRQKVMQCLRISYDGLTTENQGIFLTVACLCNKECVSRVSQYLEGVERDVKDSVNKLAEKALISISNGRVIVHDLIHDMAKEIANSERGKPRFLVDSDGNAEVLAERMETGAMEAIEGISLDISKIPDFPMVIQSFGNMRNLKYLKIHNTLRAFVEYPQNHVAINHLPRGLRLLDWGGYPLRTLPSTFDAKFLVELHLPNSKLEKLSEGNMSLKNLRRMNLAHCNNLKEIPILDGATNLEDLDLGMCSKLVPSSNFPCLQKLTRLSMGGCSSLNFLPSVAGLKSLKVVDLKGCSRLESFPELPEGIVEVYLDGTGIREVPESIQNLAALVNLSLEGCIKLSKFSSGIGNLTALTTLNLKGCYMLLGIPIMMGNLTSLEHLSLPNDISCVCKILDAFYHKKQQLSTSDIGKFIYFDTAVEVYWKRALGSYAIETLCLNGKRRCFLTHCASLSIFPHLRKLSLRNLNIKEIPNDLGDLQALQSLDLSGNTFENLPESIEKLDMLEELVLCNCCRIRRMPKLPPGVKYLYATGCLALISISSVVRHPFLQLMLNDSINLCQDSLLFIRHIMSIPFPTEEANALACFYASEVPDCFKLRRKEQKLTISCPRTGSNLKAMGFVAGVVIHHGICVRMSDLDIHCHWDGKGYQSGHINVDFRNLLPFYISYRDLNFDVLVVFSYSFGEEVSCDELSFHFDLIDRENIHRRGAKIKEVGIHLCFTEETQQRQTLLSLEEENVSAPRPKRLRIHLRK